MDELERYFAPEYGILSLITLTGDATAYVLHNAVAFKALMYFQYWHTIPSLSLTNRGYFSFCIDEFAECAVSVVGGFPCTSCFSGVEPDVLAEGDVCSLWAGCVSVLLSCSSSAVFPRNAA